MLGAERIGQVDDGLDKHTHLTHLVFGTGNGVPQYAGDTRAGDNLYLCSVVALEIKTGKLRWDKALAAGRGSLLIADGKIIALGDNGLLVLADASPGDFAEERSLAISSARIFAIRAATSPRSR